MNYAILRTQKLKSAVAVHRSLKHAYREQDTPNADPTKTPENTHIGAYSVQEGMQAFRDRLPEKVRKNGVLAVEYLITASPEAMAGKTKQEQDQYFKDALKWLEKRHGASNVFYAGIHRDEKTPHMYAYVVPKDDQGKLNCRKFLGGSKALNEMQTDFYKEVGQPHGLSRGIEGSRAKHTKVKQFYGEITKDQAIPMITPDDLKPRTQKGEGLMGAIGLKTYVETPEGVSDRLNSKVQGNLKPLQENASIAVLERKRRLELERTNRDLSEKLKETTDKLQKATALFKDLTNEQLKKVVDLAKSFLMENQEKKKLQKEKNQPKGRDFSL